MWAVYKDEVSRKMPEGDTITPDKYAEDYFREKALLEVQRRYDQKESREKTKLTKADVG